MTQISLRCGQRIATRICEEEIENSDKMKTSRNRITLPTNSEPKELQLNRCLLHRSQWTDWAYPSFQNLMNFLDWIIVWLHVYVGENSADSSDQMWSANCNQNFGNDSEWVQKGRKEGLKECSVWVYYTYKLLSPAEPSYIWDFESAHHLHLGKDLVQKSNRLFICLVGLCWALGSGSEV